MLNRLSINLVLALIVAQKAFAVRKQLTLTTEELGGDSTEISANKPLMVHLDKNSMSAEAMETLARESNIDIADLPDFPQFVTSGEFESMKYSADDLLEYLARDQDLDLDAIKQDERYYQIEDILKEITDEYSEQDERKKCTRGQRKGQGSWGKYPCGKPKGPCCGEEEDEDEDEDGDDEYWNIDDKESKYEDADGDETKWSDDDGEDEIDVPNRKNDDKLDRKLDDKLDEKLDDKVDQKPKEKLEDKFDDKFDKKPDEKVDDKLEEKLDDKLDDKFEENLGDTKNNNEPSEETTEEKEDKKELLWSDDTEEDASYKNRTSTIEKPKYEETLVRTKTNVSETHTVLAPTKSITYNTSKFSTYLIASSKVYNITKTYTTKLSSTSTLQMRTNTTTSSYYVATSLYSTSTMTTETEHEIQESSTKSAYSSSKSSTKTVSGYHETTTTSSKYEQKTSEVESNFNWKALSNVSNVTMQREIENSSNFLMPTTLLFASLLALLAVMQA
ncbi:hypothetical protein HG537_0F02360 [Torulaspora globosa]|uniref:Uncharacterized protein n=1 Tax=Torulaspora globosa TaxID=48254 RepID=A0A7H9HY48_9SACH|nr:hypothetical protein HG537_0F02360 [Torulaspora sp. CBS 2947]